MVKGLWLAVTQSPGDFTELDGLAFMSAKFQRNFYQESSDHPNGHQAERARCVLARPTTQGEPFYTRGGLNF
jgi:hypothetical protein